MYVITYITKIITLPTYITNIITKMLKCRRGSQKRKLELCGMQRTEHVNTGFENAGKVP